MMDRRAWLIGAGASGLGAVLGAGPAAGQSSGVLVFVRTRPPRELSANIRGWATANQVRAVSEDTASHVWRVQFMAFLTREPRSAEVNLVFYKMEGRTRRYISNEPVALTSPNERIFYHQTTLHRAVGEFEPMETYEVAITVADARGNSEIARGRIGLVGQVERRGNGVVDFTGGAPAIR